MSMPSRIPTLPNSKTPLKPLNRPAGQIANLRRRSREITGLIKPSVHLTPSGLRSIDRRAAVSPPPKIARSTPTSAIKCPIRPNDEIKKLEERLEKVSAENSSHKETIQNQDELLVDFRRKVEEADKSVKHFEELLVEKENIHKRKVEELESRMDLLKEKVELKEEIIETKNMMLEKKQMQMDTLNMNHDLLKDAHRVLNEEKDELKRELEAKVREIKALCEIQASLRSELRQSDLLSRKLLNDVVDLRGQIRIAIRVRPALPNENTSSSLNYPTPTSIRLDSNGKSVSFRYQKVYPPTINQKIIFEDVEELVHSCLHGYNVAIVAYGQTGSGKTYTMIGGSNEQEGLIPRAAKSIFLNKHKLFELGWTFEIKVSFLEIYVEEVYDLLNNRRQIDLKMGSGNCTASDATKLGINSEDDITEILVTASKWRSVAATKCNEQSSRSHAVFQMHIEATNEILKTKLESTLSLVDLAGSERAKESGSGDDKDRFKEMTSINLGLSNLQKCIRAQLTKSQHIPYRDSKLTMLLMSSLGGGNSKTMVIVGLNPSNTQEAESKRSLEFAQHMSMTTIGAAVKQHK
ncbi:unnamed protein product [Auanema sp. JU1783]|nr:unnamed protein product [Auanema sp. JU1783]